MAAPVQHAVLDRADALRRAGGDEKLRRELAQIFVHDLPRLTDLIQTALAQRSAHALRLAAHALKGSASQIGASALAERAAELEKLARNDDLRDVHMHQQLLAEEVRLLAVALAEEKTGPMASAAIGGNA